MSTISIFSMIIVTEIPCSIISYKNSSTLPISSKFGFFSNSISFIYTILLSIKPDFSALVIIIGFRIYNSVINALRDAFRTIRSL